MFWHNNEIKTCPQPSRTHYSFQQQEVEVSSNWRSFLPVLYFYYKAYLVIYLTPLPATCSKSTSEESEVIFAFNWSALNNYFMLFPTF